MQVFAALQHVQVQADPQVDGQPVQPVIEAQALVLNHAAIDEWEQREINARAMILFNVDDDPQVSIRGCRTNVGPKKKYGTNSTWSIPWWHQTIL